MSNQLPPFCFVRPDPSGGLSARMHSFQEHRSDTIIPQPGRAPSYSNVTDEHFTELLGPPPNAPIEWRNSVSSKAHGEFQALSLTRTPQVTFSVAGAAKSLTWRTKGPYRIDHHWQSPRDSQPKNLRYPMLNRYPWTSPLPQLPGY